MSTFSWRVLRLPLLITLLWGLLLFTLFRWTVRDTARNSCRNW